MNETEVIRVSKETKELLNTLKIIDAESFGSVVNRVLQTKFEDCIQVNESTQKLLQKRINNIKEGKLFPSRELLDRVRKKRDSQQMNDL
jgi:hypothetical protein